MKNGCREYAERRRLPGKFLKESCRHTGRKKMGRYRNSRMNTLIIANAEASGKEKIEKDFTE